MMAHGRWTIKNHRTLCLVETSMVLTTALTRETLDKPVGVAPAVRWPLRMVPVGALPCGQGAGDPPYEAWGAPSQETACSLARCRRGRHPSNSFFFKQKTAYEIRK